MAGNLSLATVQDAAALVADARYGKDGIECPCCERLAKVYRRTLTLTQIKVMARMLNIARKRVPADPASVWVKIGAPDRREDAGTTILTRGGDYAKARWWGLIEEHPPAKRQDGSSRVGLWRITERGIEFLLGAVRVPKYVWEYDSNPVPPPDGAKNPTINVYDVARSFDFKAIMEAS